MRIAPDVHVIPHHVFRSPCELETRRKTVGCFFQFNQMPAIVNQRVSRPSGIELVRIDIEEGKASVRR